MLSAVSCQEEMYVILICLWLIAFYQSQFIIKIKLLLTALWL